MNKNLVRTGIGLTVGLSLLITSTVMGMAKGPTGYEALKSAVKNSERIENATFSMSGSLKDNNKEFTKLTSTIKVAQNEAASGNISIDTDTVDKSYTFFGNENNIVFRDNDSDIYNKITCPEESRKSRNCDSKEHKNPQMEALCESVLDALVGDLKNQVTLKDIGDGNKQISINLEKDEIPAVFNLLLNAKDEESSVECKSSEKISKIFGINPKDLELPELTSNIQAEKVDVQFVVDEDNIIKEIDIEFDVTGNDAQDQVHNQNAKLSFDVSSINSTTADTVDLNGKKVKEISSKEFDCED